MRISRNMLIEDIVEQYPETIGLMQEMGVQCILCGEPVWGTLGENVRDKGLTNLDEILARLNKVVDSKNEDR